MIARSVLCAGLLLQTLTLLATAQPVAGSNPTVAVDPARIEFFSPRGAAKQVRQAVARFTTPMVALGDPRLPDPFDVDCAVGGKGRWADVRNWVYDFDSDLPAGMRCSFTLKQGIRAVNGVLLSGTRTFTFNTGGPAVVASYPSDGWQDIDEEQVFLLKLDAPATEQSIRAAAHCVVAGIEERIGVEVLSGEARAAMLRERQSLGYQYFRLLWKDGRESRARVRSRELEQAEESIAVLRCLRRLPPATEVRLQWGAGVATQSGIATTQSQQLAFRVRAAFTAQVECTRANARAGCMPMQPITVSFTAPVPRDAALAIQLKTADGKILRPSIADAKAVPTLERINFPGPFPDAAPLTVILPAVLTDDAGRTLENAARFPLQLNVDDYPPLAKFSGEFGILETKTGGVLPVTLRNVEMQLPVQRQDMPARMLRLENAAEVASWLQRVAKAAEPTGEWSTVTEINAAGQREQRSVWRDRTGIESVFSAEQRTTAFSLKKPSGEKPAEVVGIPLKNPGFYVVEIQSRRLGQSLLGADQPRYVATSALVTNLAVHFNWGRESSSVWVTRLDNGATVPGAEVLVLDYCSGGTLWQGRTDKDGVAHIAKALGAPHDNDRCTTWAPAPLMVMARKEADFSIVQSGWNQGITPSQFGLPVGGEWNADIFHTVLDRALFRSAETVSMKHFLRRHDSQGISLQADAPSKRRVTISHQGSGQTYELTAEFGADGIAEQQWKIPAEAKLGDYAISIGHEKYLRQSGRFKVEQFRLPSMRATVSGSPIALVQPKSAELDLHVAYLSGGGASGIPVKLRTMVEPRAIQYPGYDDYHFGGTPVKEGIVTGEGAYFDFDAEGEETPEPGKVQVLPLTLDGEGAARVTIANLPTLDAPAQLRAEIEYADANGELLTASGRVQLVPSTLSVGIRREGWAASSEQLRFRVVVLGQDGKPRARHPVTVALFQSSAYSYRKRLIGGFYAYETTRETTKLPVTCAGQTNEQGLLMCDVAPGVSGEVIARAQTMDEQRRQVGATSSFWVAGQDDWWFGGTQGDRMDVLPEKKEYEAGDVARFQVRMPFRSATALVTVEREGVLSSFVTRLKGREPIIEVPIADAYAPNVFVSVLALRGRVAHTEIKRPGQTSADEVTALVDLNKPAYRLGMARINVGWKPHRLNVLVTPQQKTFKVGEKAGVQIHVERADGKPLPANTEIAVAAVDEALLELAPNPSWDVLRAMMGERGVEVWTSTAQMQVVGKRHYGRKAVPHGGGGGRERDRAREMFDSLLYWQSRVQLDAQGNAQLAVPLNDSLSSFRIVAIANGAAQLFGTGAASISTTQDLILLSGLAPLVREGDRYTATFTLRNTTNRPLTVVVDAAMTPAPAQALATQRVEIQGGEARDLGWQVTAPVGATQLQWEVSAREVNGAASDRIKVNEAVIPAFPVRTYQATIAQLSEALSVPAAQPAGSVKGRGGLEVALRAKLGDSLEGVKEYMSWYPYICIEQQLSRAVALRDRRMWDSWRERLPAYMDGDGLLKYFPSDRIEGDDALTAYVLALSDEAGWALIETDRDRMINALSRFVSGKLVRRSALPTADLAIRKLAAIEALSRYGAAQAAMLDSITIEPNLWPTSAVIDWANILKRVANIARAEQRRADALGILRARLNFQGTIMGFSTERSDALWWLMISADSNANRMLLSVMDEAQWRDDIPRLVRGALGRQRRGHWNTTVANAWGVLAMEKFSAAFESVAVSGASIVQYGTHEQSVDWAQSRNTQVDLPWQEERASLEVKHRGEGRPWVMIRATAALPLDKPLSTGFRIARTVTPVDQQAPGRWTRGDVARVKLELEAQSDMSWVVVDDPVPGGATVLGSGLGGQSELLTRDERNEGWAWLAFEERRFDAFRAYYRYVPKGRWTVEYTVRLNNPGTFQLPATRVEAMYAPEMFGEIPNASITVEPRQ